MKNIIPKKEWKKLNYEMLENKPKDIPYPPKRVKKRELLLTAQCLLIDFEMAETRKEREFFAELYGRTMKAYYSYS